MKAIRTLLAALTLLVVMLLAACSTAVTNTPDTVSALDELFGSADDQGDIETQVSITLGTKASPEGFNSQLTSNMDIWGWQGVTPKGRSFKGILGLQGSETVNELQSQAAVDYRVFGRRVKLGEKKRLLGFAVDQSLPEGERKLNLMMALASDDQLGPGADLKDDVIDTIVTVLCRDFEYRARKFTNSGQVGLGITMNDLIITSIAGQGVFEPTVESQTIMKDWPVRFRGTGNACFEGQPVSSEAGDVFQGVTDEMTLNYEEITWTFTEPVEVILEFLKYEGIDGE